MYIKCVQCGKTFDLSEAEKEFYEEKNLEIFINCMARLHCQHLKHDIAQFIKSVSE